MRLRSLLLGAAFALTAVSAHAQVPGYPAFFPPLTSGNCVQANSPFQATTTAAPCGVGTVSAGLINQLAWYAATGNAVSGLATANNGTLVTSAGGVPSISSTLPNAVQDNITRSGTLVSGATGAGFTLALGSSTITGILAGANGGTANGFFAVSGPTTALKTFTFPNASATVLTDNAVVTSAQGGTGVANTGKTITLGGSLTTSGAFDSTFTMTNTTAVTFPTAGTLATLAGSETLTNKVLITGGATSVPTVAGASSASLVSAALGAGASRQVSRWDNVGGGITDYVAKSRSGTIGTTGGAIVTGNDLYLMRIYGDDGTNLSESSRITFTTTGTIALGQVPGTLNLGVANSLGSMVQVVQLTGSLANMGNGAFTATVSGGAQVGAPTGGDKGAGTINAAAAYYANGTVGVSCAANSITLLTEVVTNGIVTHC